MTGRAESARPRDEKVDQMFSAKNSVLTSRCQAGRGEWVRPWLTENCLRHSRCQTGTCWLGTSRSDKKWLIWAFVSRPGTCWLGTSLADRNWLRCHTRQKLLIQSYSYSIKKFFIIVQFKTSVSRTKFWPKGKDRGLSLKLWIF